MRSTTHRGLSFRHGWPRPRRARAGATAETAALREQLAAAQVSREAARGESAGLQAELQRLGRELAATRERVGAETGDLGQANRLLADARALADQLRASG